MSQGITIFSVDKPEFSPARLLEAGCKRQGSSGSSLHDALSTCLGLTLENVHLLWEPCDVAGPARQRTGESG